MGVAVSCASGDIASAGAATISSPFSAIVNSTLLPGVDRFPEDAERAGRSQIRTAAPKRASNAQRARFFAGENGLEALGGIGERRAEACRLEAAAFVNEGKLACLAALRIGDRHQVSRFDAYDQRAATLASVSFSVLRQRRNARIADNARRNGPPPKHPRMAIFHSTLAAECWPLPGSCWQNTELK